MKVNKKQSNSHYCLICGIDNPLGLKANFYEMENKMLVGIFTGNQHHQSYPDRMHGGMISAILDEVMVRSIWIDEPTTWGVTIDLKVKFRQPVPINQKLFAISIITRNAKRIFSAISKIIDEDKNTLAEGAATFWKVPKDKVGDLDNYQDHELIVYQEDDIFEIDIDNIYLKEI